MRAALACQAPGEGARVPADAALRGHERDAGGAVPREPQGPRALRHQRVLRADARAVRAGGRQVRCTRSNQLICIVLYAELIGSGAVRTAVYLCSCVRVRAGRTHGRST